MAVIAASILDADFSRLKDEMLRVVDAGIDAFSLDVMDGHFVPRCTFGELLVAQIRSWVDVPLEVHLMVQRPETWVRRMSDAGADMVMFHLEATDDPLAVAEQIRVEGRVVGLALRHDTPVDAIASEALAAVDVVNLVAVPVGWGGSASADDTLDRVAHLRERIEATERTTAIEVDGGVKPSNATMYVDAGADMLTSGTGIYHARDVAEAVTTLRTSTRGRRDDEARRRLTSYLAVPSSRAVGARG